MAVLGAATTIEQSAAEKTEPEKASTSAQQPPVYTLSAEEYREMMDNRARLAEIEANAAKAALAAQEKEFQQLTEKGKLTEALEMIRKQREEDNVRLTADAHRQLEEARKQAASTLEEAKKALAAKELHERELAQRTANYALRGELSRALASHNLNEGSAEELVNILGPQLNVQPDGDGYSVRNSSGQSVAEHVGAYLKRCPHHLKAQNPAGGTGGLMAAMQTPAPGTPSPTDGLQPPNGLNFGEMTFWMAKNQLIPTAPSFDDTLTKMSLPMGLKKLG